MRIIMVCLGNICRSPLAQGILEKKIKDHGLDWKVDSAGTSGWHDGEKPDFRSIEVALKNGIDISHQRSRRFVKEDFEVFDIIVAMDSSNYSNILKIDEDATSVNKVKLLMNFTFPEQNRQVPDPYYNDSFEECFELIDKACSDIIQKYTHPGSKSLNF